MLCQVKSPQIQLRFYRKSVHPCTSISIISYLCKPEAKYWAMHLVAQVGSLVGVILKFQLPLDLFYCPIITFYEMVERVYEKQIPAPLRLNTLRRGLLDHTRRHTDTSTLSFNQCENTALQSTPTQTPPAKKERMPFLQAETQKELRLFARRD